MLLLQSYIHHALIIYHASNLTAHTRIDINLLLLFTLISYMHMYNKYTQNDHIVSMSAVTCNDLARIALAFVHTSMMLSLPYRSPKTWDLLENGFLHGYVGESVACLFTQGSIGFNY